HGRVASFTCTYVNTREQAVTFVSSPSQVQTCVIIRVGHDGCSVLQCSALAHSGAGRRRDPNLVQGHCAPRAIDPLRGSGGQCGKPKGPRWPRSPPSQARLPAKTPPSEASWEAGSGCATGACGRAFSPSSRCPRSWPHSLRASGSRSPWTTPARESVVQG